MPISDAALGLVVEQLGDPDDGVRSAAHDALGRGALDVFLLSWSRSPTRDAAAAARELLAAELPPADELSTASQPRAAASRGTRSRLGAVHRRR